jgi:hypothetical protein
MKQSAISKAAAAMGRKGGSVKCSKGFASPRVMAKALATRKRNKQQLDHKEAKQ